MTAPLIKHHTRLGKGTDHRNPGHKRTEFLIKVRKEKKSKNSFLQINFKIKRTTCEKLNLYKIAGANIILHFT